MCRCRNNEAVANVNWNVERLSVGTEVFEGPSNAYLLGHAAQGPTTLVDTGVSTRGAKEQFRKHLNQHGIAVRDIDQILLTHFHYDHAGLAGWIQSRSDATVYCHEADAALVGYAGEAVVDLYRNHRSTLESWQIPNREIEELLSFLDSTASLAGEEVTVTPIADGTTIQVGEDQFECIALPGHTAGHAGYATGSILYGGDALLPEYTPNIGGGDLRVTNPLATYLQTLQRIVDADYASVFPGHREEITEPAERVAMIAAHHRHRLRAVLDVLADEGACTVWEMAQSLFGELAGIHLLHGPGEAFAHLDYLVELELVNRERTTYVVDDSNHSHQGSIPNLLAPPDQ